MTIAEHMVGPKAGKVGVWAFSGTTALAAQDFFGGTPRQGTQYFTMICDVAWYLITSDKSDTTSLPAPDPTTTGAFTSASVDGRCVRIPADFPYPIEVSPESRYFRAVSVGGGTLRVHPSSPFGS